MASNSNGFPWELVIWAGVIGFFAIPLFLWRRIRSVRSWLYVGREKKLAVVLCELIEKKCKLLEKSGRVQKEYEDYELESSLEDNSFEKEAAEAQSLQATCKKLNRSISEIEDEIFYLQKELKEERSKHTGRDNLMADISKMIHSLEDHSTSLKLQIAEAKMTFSVFQMNGEQLKTVIKDALNENSQLQESHKQLLQEAAVWKEHVSELNQQKISFEDSKVHTEQILIDKDDHIKTLTEHLLKIKDWAAMLGEDRTDDCNLKLEMNNGLENGVYLDDTPKGALKKLIHAAKLRTSLTTLEEERNQIYIQMSKINKTKKDLRDHIEHFQSEQASLQSENTHFESENQKLQQQLKVMTELHEETAMRLYKKLIVEENYQSENEEKLSKVDRKINYTTDQMENYRKQAEDLEEKLERMILSYRGQMISYKKKEDDNWLAAQTAEGILNDIKKENAHRRQKLTEMEFKFKFLHKDPSARDVPNTGFGRKHYPHVTDMRRGPPCPPPPPGIGLGVSPHDFPPRNFAGPPYAPFAMRNAYPPRPFPPYLPPRPGFFLPTPKY
ncbi:melanoma inhibitory activity protein 2-like [Cebus imitator]|uniref:melanoma inhibitory activity protein 2-like n=1 Tax=Cebus imitator TaxID=2715852 RepID=UPI00189BDB7D|nr:melanoma inhibitory activity protein 2-like [Cebus imitator]